MAEPLRVLMVCLGNICRSPMAEGALRARLEQQGLAAAVEVDSAGTGGWHVGEPPDPRAIAVARAHGVEIADLRGRQLQPQDFTRFDLLLCADHANLRDVRAQAPAVTTARSALLLEFAGMSGPVPDPYTGTARDFARVWQMVDDAAVASLARLRREIGGLDA